MTEASGDSSAGDSKAAASEPRARSNPIRATWRTGAFFLWTTYCLTGVIVARLFSRGAAAKRTASHRWTHRWLKGCARVMSVHLSVIGEPPPPGTFLAPNHTGYLDIVALGAVYPTFFVVKAEAADWPFFGSIIKHSETIPIRRGRRRDVLAVREEIVARLEDRQSVCAFLEGTSTGSDRVLPFHASLLAPALDGGYAVAPVAIAWRTPDPRFSVIRDIAYWGDHVLLSHLWRMLGIADVEVDVVFGEAIAADGRDRKDVAGELRRSVVNMLRDRGIEVE